MSDTQIIIALAVGVSMIVIFGCLILVVVARLRRVVKLQFETIDSLLSALRARQERDKLDEPDRPG
ncbi:MAG: hypothetical protein M3460_09985 [Actinomycetota bacterium]|nr:hypothetical protein [Actinomycetota bacterium]